jgi:CMP-N,N'-diacetyllegionaminic acid synthase
MYKDKSIIAIIPARGQSKRLPKKNILNFNGKPLIAWTIEAALQSKYIDKVIVSSEDNKILQISKEYGADIIKRPNHLADDTSITFEALEHVIKNTRKFYYVMLLQATSPLRNSKHIDESIELLENKKANSIISVCKVAHSPLWSNILPEDGSMVGFIKDNIKHKRSQDLEPYYRINGAIYLTTTTLLVKNKTFFLNKNIFAYKMERKDSIDIDETLDFMIAEKIMQAY